ncbi:hypothetical protein GW17_00054962 [Ensete ventricosum]|nr:hypothetical protein GW17_00054962 [Ensete ventricosum]
MEGWVLGVCSRHGVRQMRTAWADGPEFVTQCPIRPGGSYTYRFTIEGQEGTLWWHAHSSWLRATVYGALIIHPKENSSYPFTEPKREVPVNGGIGIRSMSCEKQPVPEQLPTSPTHSPSVASPVTSTIAPTKVCGCLLPSHHHPHHYLDPVVPSLILYASVTPPVLAPPATPSADTTVIPVKAGETNLLRFINAALNTELFVAIANHKMTVVSADASYTKPFTTSVLMLGPGQTTDVLVTMDQPASRYYIAARAYASAQGVAFDNTTTTAILEYDCGCSEPGQGIPPVFPALPAYNDTGAASAFSAGLRSLSTVDIPGPVDENLFFTVGLGLFKCPPGKTCGGPNNTRMAASINNVSFVLPDTYSILQAHYQRVPGVFTTDFPAVPPVQFDYTAQNVSRSLWQPVAATKVYKLKYGSVVQLVLQGTNIFAAENHPIHIHGYDFYILAEGFGNFNAAKDNAKFNLVDPPMRNTVGVPVSGWAVIRFVADNPGVWLMHCHLDVHITWGLAMAFLVEDGVGELQSLEEPPVDLPVC